MSYETRPNSGALFKNKHKKDERHPDMKGDVLVNGKMMECACWVKRTKSGEPWLSLSFQEPRPRKEEREPQPRGLFEEDPF